MVKVEEVSDSPYASSSSSRTASTESLSSLGSEGVEDSNLDEETLFERLTALVDIVPPTTRHSISMSVSKTASAFKNSGKWLGNVMWILSTSALLVALPLALTLEDEAKLVVQEKELLAQQQGAQSMLAPYPGGSGAPQNPQQALVPPGF